jgi:hypothetical protein
MVKVEELLKPTALEVLIGGGKRTYSLEKILCFTRQKFA